MKYVELCAGIGGLRLGLETAGWDTVGAVEWDADAVAVHRTAFGDCREEDVFLLNPEELPEHDVLAAGFPCQPFSSSGHRTGFEHRSGTVFERVLEIAAVKRPAGILLENVKGLLSNESGYTMARVLKGLTNAGYDVTWSVVNASWLGVPQNRPRVVLFAVRSQGKHAVAADLLGHPNYVELFAGNQVFAALRRELGIGVKATTGGTLTSEIERLSPRIGKAKIAGTPFGPAGVAVGDAYQTADIVEPPRRSQRLLGPIVCPSFWKRDEVKSARYWGHTGTTRAYLNDGEVAHCIGTSIGAAPMFGIEESFVRTRKDELALLEFANWSRSEGGVRIFRLTPQQGIFLFGQLVDPIAEALKTHTISQTKIYQLIGNMVVPEVGALCGRVMGTLLNREEASSGSARGLRAVA